MAEKKAAEKKNGKSFEEALWDSANRLRGSVESSEYKHVVLSLIFLKFVSDKFEERRAELIAEGKEKYIDMVWSSTPCRTSSSDEFRLKVQECLETAVAGKRRDSFTGEEIRMHDELEAERLFQQGLDCCGLAEDELSRLKKGDARKKVIAWYVRKNTSVRVEWITKRLQMGSTSNFSYNYRAVETAREGELWKLKINLNPLDNTSR